MNILVLGDSDISGRFSEGVTWPRLLAESLKGDGNTEAVVTAIPFSAASPSAADYARKKVAEVSPELVIMVLGSYPFTAKFVWLRMERMLGKRAGNWYKALEDGFEDRTRDRSGGRDLLNRVARRVVPAVMRPLAFCSRDELTANYRKVFGALAQFEDMRIIIMSYPGLGAHARTGNAPQERTVFFAAMREAARGHRFSWVDGVRIFAGSSGTLKRDQLHFNADGHRLMAAAIFEAVGETSTVLAP